jgi:hypothetical protein
MGSTTDLLGEFQGKHEAAAGCAGAVSEAYRH